MHPHAQSLIYLNQTAKMNLAQVLYHPIQEMLKPKVSIMQEKSNKDKLLPKSPTQQFLTHAHKNLATAQTKKYQLQPKQ